jgi:WD40 repeat protein
VQADWSTTLQTLQGHTGWVKSVAFSPDGKHVVSGSNDKTIQIWEAGTGAVLQTLQGHTDWVRSVAFSPGGQHVVSSSNDETVRVWDASTGVVIQTLVGSTDRVSSVAFSPDNKILPTLLVLNNWIVEGGTKILWLPPDYQSPTCVATCGGSVVLGYTLGRISILGFQGGPKFL